MAGQYDDCMEFVARGRYLEKNGTKYIIYKEHSEGAPSNYNICIIKIEQNNNIMLIKNGKTQSKLIFEKNQRHYCPYETDYGMMNMSVYTHNVKTVCEADHGFVNIKYSMDMNSGIMSIMNIFITYEKIAKTPENVKNMLESEELQNVHS